MLDFIPQTNSITNSDISVTHSGRPQQLPRQLAEEYLREHPHASKAEIRQALKECGINKTLQDIKQILKNIRRAQSQQKRPKQKKTKTNFAKSPLSDAIFLCGLSPTKTTIEHTTILKSIRFFGGVFC